MVAHWWLGEPQPPANGTGNDYRPHVDAKRFHFLGNLGLLRPDALHDDEARPIAIDFVGCDGEGRAAACSFGTGAHVETMARLDAFVHAIFIGGEIRLLRRDLAGRELLIAITDGLAFTDGEFADLAESIIRLERDFFADPGDARFVITVVPELRTNGIKTRFHF